MSVRCQAPHCREVAVVLVRDRYGDEAAVCRWHWRDMERHVRGGVTAVRLAR